MRKFAQKQKKVICFRTFKLLLISISANMLGLDNTSSTGGLEAMEDL